MSKTTPHLSALDRALKKQGVELKRTALLEVMASAFGFHNSHELTAAISKGKIPPPPAKIPTTNPTNATVEAIVAMICDVENGDTTYKIATSNDDMTIQLAEYARKHWHLRSNTKDDRDPYDLSDDQLVTAFFAENEAHSVEERRHVLTFRPDNPQSVGVNQVNPSTQSLKSRSAIDWRDISSVLKSKKPILLWLREPFSRAVVATWNESWNNWTADGDLIDYDRDEITGIGKDIPILWAPIDDPFAVSKTPGAAATKQPAAKPKCRATIRHTLGPTILERDTERDLYRAIADWCRNFWIDAPREAQEALDFRFATHKEIMNAYFDFHPAEAIELKLPDDYQPTKRISPCARGRELLGAPDLHFAMLEGFGPMTFCATSEDDLYKRLSEALLAPDDSLPNGVSKKDFVENKVQMEGGYLRIKQIKNAYVHESAFEANYHLWTCMVTDNQDDAKLDVLIAPDRARLTHNILAFCKENWSRTGWPQHLIANFKDDEIIHSFEGNFVRNTIT